MSAPSPEGIRLTPEEWKTYWRTCHLTPFQVLELERQDMEAFFYKLDLTGFSLDAVDACTDALELQLMGIHP